MSNCLLHPWHKTFAKDFIIVFSWVQYIHAYNSILFSIPIHKRMGKDYFPYLIKGALRSMYIIDRKSGNPIIWKYKHIFSLDLYLIYQFSTWQNLLNNKSEFARLRTAQWWFYFWSNVENFGLVWLWINQTIQSIVWCWTILAIIWLNF